MWSDLQIYDCFDTPVTYLEIFVANGKMFSTDGGKNRADHQVKYNRLFKLLHC